METEFTVSKFDTNYYRNRYVSAMASISEKITTIVDVKEQLKVYTNAFNKEEFELIETKNYLKTAHWTIDNLETKNDDLYWQISDLKQRLIKANERIVELLTEEELTLTETSQLDNTGNNNNE